MINSMLIGSKQQDYAKREIRGLKLLVAIHWIEPFGPPIRTEINQAKIVIN